MRPSPLRALYASNAIFIVAESMLVPLYALFAEEIGASVVTIGYLGSAVIAARILGLVFVRQFDNDRFASKFYLVGGFLIRALAWGSLIFANSISTLFVIQILIGLGAAIGSPGFLAFFAEHLSERSRITRSADWGIIEGIAGVIGAAVAGNIVALYGFDMLFGVMAVLAVCAALIFFLLESNKSVV